MDWYAGVLEVIDMRSFTSVWYWIMLAVAWSTSSHWILGVPFDAINRARRAADEPNGQLEFLVRINCERLVYIVDTAGVWIMAFATCMLTILAALGFWYEIELCQAIFLIAFPMSLLFGASIRTARRLLANETAGEALYTTLSRQRLFNQVIGMISIFITAFWGMWHNLNATVL